MPTAHPLSPVRPSLTWSVLQAHRDRLEGARIESFFEEEPNRLYQLSFDWGGFHIDVSKASFDTLAWEALLDLARESGIEAMRVAKFRGDAINHTEKRAVLHSALRRPKGLGPLVVDGVDVHALVHQSLDRMIAFTDAVLSKGDITDVLVLGIGGSDLGPQMVIEALKDQGQGLPVRFLSNPDTPALHRALSQIDLSQTLLVISSKSFTTPETLLSFESVLEAMSEALGSKEAALMRCVAITASPDRATAKGIHPDRVFEFWEWVGGRTSVWSAIGLPILLALGAETFLKLLAGGYAMDRHFQETPLPQNLPVVLALVGLWNHSVLHHPSVMVAAYDSRLVHWVPYLQQLEMESNGKSVDFDGNALQHGSAPIVWGGLGINGQHAYFQMVHQGTQVVPVEFLGVLSVPASRRSHQALVLSSMIAQAEALLKGRSFEDSPEPKAHRTFPGDTPSTTVLVDALTPERLGALIALYEHKVFVQGILLHVQSYDQWGVELGKELAQAVLQALEAPAPSSHHDPSTLDLITRIKDSLPPE